MQLSKNDTTLTSTSFHPSPLIELPLDIWVHVFRFLSVIDLVCVVRRVKCIKKYLSMYGKFIIYKWLCDTQYPEAASGFFVRIVLKTRKKHGRAVLLHSSGWSTEHNTAIKMFLNPPLLTAYKRKKLKLTITGGRLGHSESIMIWIDDQFNVVWRDKYVKICFNDFT